VQEGENEKDVGVNLKGVQKERGVANGCQKDLFQRRGKLGKKKIAKKCHSEESIKRQNEVRRRKKL